MPTPTEWGLRGIERVDVNQADIAPLMATIVGLPCPVNSVGNLPLGYLSLSKAEEVEAALANTKQILNQFLQKSQLKQLSSLYFRPYKPLANYSSFLGQIEDLIAVRNYEAALKTCHILRDMSLAGLHYFQTYDWLMLMTTITLGYIGWMVNLILHVLQSYTILGNLLLKKSEESLLRITKEKVYLGGCLLMSLLSIILFLENSPLLYHAYVSMTVFLWTQILSKLQLINAIWKEMSSKDFKSSIKLLAVLVMSFIVLEFLVASFSDRKLYTWFFLVAGLLAASHVLLLVPGRYIMALYICLSCWFLSMFTLMPAEIPDNNPLVIASGALIVFIGMASRWLDSSSGHDKFRLYIVQISKQGSHFHKLFLVQAILVALSSVMVWISTSHRALKKELLPVHQLINWSIAVVSMVIPLVSPTSILSRLTSIFLGFAPPFLLLSIGYEAVFYSALALVLMGWILLECANLYSAEYQGSLHMKNLEDSIIGDYKARSLQLSDLRIPLIFMVLFNIAFFGTGNFASIASFEISSVYRFITIFSPFLMAALLIFKLFIPFLLVICVFSAITKLIRVPRLGCYFLVVVFSDVMTIHFFFLVRNTGSWMEIGNSISHFGIMSAQVVFILLLFALTNIYTKDIEVLSLKLSSGKAT